MSLVLGLGCGAVSTALLLRSRLTSPVIPLVPSSSGSVQPKLTQATPKETSKESALTHCTEQIKQAEQLELQLVELQQTYFRTLELSQFKAGFLARTSHELRSPLNGVIGMHQLILADLCDSPEEERDFLQQAHTSVLKTLGLLDELIAISKIEYGTGSLCLEPVQLAELFKEVQATVHLQAENRNLRLQVVVPDADVEALADWKQLRQVLVSLLDTAISHMDSGQIRLRIYPSAPNEPVRIWLEDQRPASVWREALDLLNANDPSIQSIQSNQKVVPTVIEQILAENSDSLHPSMSLGLLMNCILLHCMGGKLTVLQTPISHVKNNLAVLSAPDPLTDDEWPNLTRLECCLPRQIGRAHV